MPFGTVEQVPGELHLGDGFAQRIGQEADAAQRRGIVGQREGEVAEPVQTPAPDIG